MLRIILALAVLVLSWQSVFAQAGAKHGNTIILLLSGQGQDAATVSTRDRFEQKLSALQSITLLPLDTSAEWIDSLQLLPAYRNRSPQEIAVSRLHPDWILSVAIPPTESVSGRQFWLPTLGQVAVSRRAEVILRNTKDTSGTATLTTAFAVDTVLRQGWCGVLTCTVTPLPAIDRERIESNLDSRIAALLADRLRKLVDIPQNASSAH